MAWSQGAVLFIEALGKGQPPLQSATMISYERTVLLISRKHKEAAAASIHHAMYEGIYLNRRALPSSVGTQGLGGSRRRHPRRRRRQAWGPCQTAACGAQRSRPVAGQPQRQGARARSISRDAIPVSHFHVHTYLDACVHASGRAPHSCVSREGVGA